MECFHNVSWYFWWYVLDISQYLTNAALTFEEDTSISISWISHRYLWQYFLGMSSMCFHNFTIISSEKGCNAFVDMWWFQISVMIFQDICDEISVISRLQWRCWPERGRQSRHTNDEGEEHDEEEDGHKERQHVTGTLTLPCHRHVGRQGRPGVRGHTATVLVLLQTWIKSFNIY